MYNLGKVKVELTLIVPEGISKKDLRDYILDAVSYWNKGGDPADPLWGINNDNVKVGAVKKII